MSIELDMLAAPQPEPQPPAGFDFLKAISFACRMIEDTSTSETQPPVWNGETISERTLRQWWRREYPKPVQIALPGTGRLYPLQTRRKRPIPPGIFVACMVWTAQGGYRFWPSVEFWCAGACAGIAEAGQPYTRELIGAAAIRLARLTRDLVEMDQAHVAVDTQLRVFAFFAPGKGLFLW